MEPQKLTKDEAEALGYSDLSTDEQEALGIQISLDTAAPVMGDVKEAEFRLDSQSQSPSLERLQNRTEQALNAPSRFKEWLKSKATGEEPLPTERSKLKPEQIQQMLRKRSQEVDASVAPGMNFTDIDPINAVLQGFAAGNLVQMGDEALGLLAGDEAKKEMRVNQDLLREAYPKLSLAGEFGGAMTSPVNKLIPGAGAESLGARILHNLGVGAAYGLGESDAPLGSDTVIDTAIGAAGGALGGLAGEGLGWAGRKLLKKVPQSFLRSFGGDDKKILQALEREAKEVAETQTKDLRATNAPTPDEQAALDLFEKLHSKAKNDLFDTQTAQEQASAALAGDLASKERALLKRIIDRGMVPLEERSGLDDYLVTEAADAVSSQEAKGMADLERLLGLQRQGQALAERTQSALTDKMSEVSQSGVERMMDALKQEGRFSDLNPAKRGNVMEVIQQSLDPNAKGISPVQISPEIQEGLSSKYGQILAGLEKQGPMSEGVADKMSPRLIRPFKNSPAEKENRLTKLLDLSAKGEIPLTDEQKRAAQFGIDLAHGAKAGPGVTEVSGPMEYIWKNAFTAPRLSGAVSEMQRGAGNALNTLGASSSAVGAQMGTDLIVAPDSAYKESPSSLAKLSQYLFGSTDTKSLQEAKKVQEEEAIKNYALQGRDGGVGLDAGVGE